MEGRGDQQPGLAGLRRDQFLGEDGILIGVAGFVLEDQPIGADAKRREQARRGVRIALALDEQFAGAARDDDLRVGKAPRQDRRLDEAVAAAVQFIAAARQIDGALEAAAEHDDAVDLLRQRRAREALLQRIEHHGAERRPGRQRKDQEGEHTAGRRQPPPAEQRGEQRQPAAGRSQN